MASLMLEIYEPSRHEALAGPAWNADVVKKEIAHIIEDFKLALQPSGGWPTHPLEDGHTEPKWALYSGAAGAVVALRILLRANYIALDYSDLLPRIHDAYLKHPDYGYQTGLQLGEIGILTPAVLVDPDDRNLTNRLVDCMKRTIGHVAREITSGEAGMMHAALSLFRHTQDELWKDLYCEAAHSLWEAWEYAPAARQWLWRNEIFGSTRAYYGACHGVAGNAHALLRGADLLPDEWTETIIRRTADTLAEGAIRNDRYANWPLSADPPPVGKKRLVQWCHGAPGVVTALACARQLGFECSAGLAALVDAAGEQTWIAGPLKKGSGICHGTAGNGFAFLALHKCTGDVAWLHRARQFAMHAIIQRRNARQQYGQGRYTLWTGDGGLAVYLHYCLNPQSVAFPGLEIF
jgi:hypothetical protein